MGATACGSCAGTAETDQRASGRRRTRAPSLERELGRLNTLQRFALPLVHFLDQSPGNTTWSEWLDWLERLATMAIRQPETVLAVLAELRPMAMLARPVSTRFREALSER